CEFVEFAVELFGIDRDLHDPAQGCRFQSLYIRYVASPLPKAPNHCGQYGPIQMKSPAATGYQSSPSLYIPRPSSMRRPCSITWISTIESDAPGWYVIRFTAQSNAMLSGNRCRTAIDSSPSSGSEGTADVRPAKAAGGRTPSRDM